MQSQPETHSRRARQLAVYGKGGIGKSTIIANLSASLAQRGQRVLQIGCDPKHDSTRLLLGGRRIETVLDYIRTVKPLDYKLEDILTSGYLGIGCIEAGGPVPGVGCAGRGIITAFKLLEDFEAKQNYDVVCYDVLGDVVCGGFAVPIRREYADEIFVVTSGEYMSLYAANNILRGIANYDGTRARVGGLIFNARNVAGEDERVAAFAKAVKLPVLLRVPRDDAFAHAETARCTVVELGESQALVAAFAGLADTVLAGTELHAAHPLDDDELEAVVLGASRQQQESGSPTKAAVASGSNLDDIALHSIREADGDSATVGLTSPNRYLSLNVIHDEPLHGCAFNGAISMATHLRDVVVLAHSPSSCAYITHQTVTSTGRRRFFERGSLLPVNITPNMGTTAMSEADMVFGGMDRLRDKVNEAKQGRPPAIVVVSACPAGIIGDDIDQVAELSDINTQVIPVKADGNAAGDYLQGMLMAYTGLARAIIDPSITQVPDTVNVVFEKVIATNTDTNFAQIERLLARLGITVNCRFLCETEYEKLRTFTSAPLNLLAFTDYTGQLMRKFFTDEYGSHFLDRGFPVGLSQTKAWLRDIAQFFGRESAAEQVIAEYESGYERELERLRPMLAGKRLMVVTYNHDIDWVLEAARGVGIEVAKICVLPFSQDEGFRTELDGVVVEQNYDYSRRADDVASVRPDILLTNYESMGYGQVGLADTIPMCPDVGFGTGLALMRRWSVLLRANMGGEWRNDADLLVGANI